MRKAILRLKDGKEFEGIAFGAEIALEAGEVVFNTGTLGYQEILTDPSYNGQIVTLTTPMVGNYGIELNDSESSGVKATALVVKKLYRGGVMQGRLSLDEFLKKSGVPLLEGVDTRALTLYLREHGSQNGILFYEDDRAKAIDKLDSYPSITDIDLVDGVSVKSAIKNPSLGEDFPPAPEKSIKHFAVVDFGIKKSIIANFYSRGIAITLLPPTTTSKDVLDLDADALFLSNGPGDPALLSNAIDMAKECLGKLPVMGICLGHQIITHALGGTTEKMKFGHHGSNHPIKDMFTGRVFVTAQNHGFMSKRDSLPENVSIWFENANDGTVEGLVCEDLHVRSVQFHPEAAPGPEEARIIFDSFIGCAK